MEAVARYIGMGGTPDRKGDSREISAVDFRCCLITFLTLELVDVRVNQSKGSSC